MTRKFLASIGLVIAMIFPAVTSADCELTIELDSLVVPQSESVTIPVYITNTADTIAGFEFWVVLNRPDLMRFSITPGMITDTTYFLCFNWNGMDCTDTLDVTDSLLFNPSFPYDWIEIETYEAQVSSIDTIGTLTSGWDILKGVSIGGLGYDQKITGIATTQFTPDNSRYLYPSDDKKPLMYLNLEMYDLGEIIYEETATIYMQANVLDFFNFANPDGQTIGLIIDTIVSQTCFQCLQYAGETCLSWEVVNCDSEPYDSIWCCDTAYQPIIDTSYLCVENGYITVIPYLCGDASGDDLINLLDITFLISYLYLDGQAPEPILQGDVNNDGVANLLDITYLINFLYADGLPPDCSN